MLLVTVPFSSGIFQATPAEAEMWRRAFLALGPAAEAFLRAAAA